MHVGIIGIGLSEFGIIKEPFYNISFQAAKRALENASIDRSDIDSFVLGGHDSIGTGRTISNMYIAPSAGAYLKHEIRVQDDAAFALAQAFIRIKSGLSDICMVLGFGKSSETLIELIELQSLDPFFHRPLNLTITMSFAMQSYRYRRTFGVNDEKIAECIVKDRENGSKNPNAFLREKVSVDDVLNSKMIIYPLRELEIAPYCDGCVALILANEDVAKRFCDDPIWIKGIGWSTAGYFFEEMETLPATKIAGNMAFKMAKIKKKDLDSIELMNLVSDHKCMILEALGLAELGRGYEVLESLDVNNSGGAICTNTYGSTGLFLIAHLVERIRKGEVENGLAQAMSSYAGKRACVSILGV
ncbi:MAG: thiolase family protein [Archaeoglobaceae archaeon]|nr:thiolase family protein [Archaeoglobaceae archaeon]